MRRSIRGKMILFIGLPAGLIFVGMMVWILRFSERQERDLQGAEMAERAASAAARFDDYIGKAARVAETTARFVEVVPDLAESQIYGLLEGTVKLNRRIYGAAMAFEPGTFKESGVLFCPYVYEGGPDRGLARMDINADVYDWYHDEQWQWWHLPKKRGIGVWTDPYFDEGAGNILMTTHAVPFQRGGRFGGVTTVDIDLGRLGGDVVASIPGIGQFYILGPGGMVIHSPDPGEIMEETIYERLEAGGQGDLRELVGRMLEGESGEAVVEGLFGSGRMLIAHAPISSSGWTFLAFRPEREAMAGFHQRRAVVVCAFLAAAGLLAATVLFMSGQVARPIGLLRHKVLQIADGAEGVSLDEVRTGDEIEELAGAFGTMQRKVHDREAKLRNARETTLTELLDSAPDAMLIVDGEGKVRRANGQAEELFGFPSGELVGSDIETLLPERFTAGHGAPPRGYFANPGPRQVGAGLELCGMRRDGREFPVEIGLSPFHDPEGLMAVAAIRDITERKRAEAELKLAREQAEAANRAKSDFLSSMSHELRTPLNGILGYAQILERDKDANDRQKGNVESIISCGDHLLSLINDVLDLSKIEAGRIELEEAPCDLERLVKGLNDIVGERARSKGIGFRMEVSPEVPRGIVTDAAKLRQILVNLLGNAVKFTGEGAVRLVIRESGEGRLVFEVIDTGVGMGPEELEEIFDPFKQVEAGKAAGGTGLGLAICRRLLDKMGGSIVVESEKGKGSCFRVEIPLTEADEEGLGALGEKETAELADATLAPGQSVRILVADDREVNRHILEQLLEDAGFTVILADDGDTALEALRGGAFDLVLLDVRMPRLNGIETVRAIRADPDLKDLVVVAVTASVFPEFRERAIAEGFDDFLGKPFRTSELMQKLKHHLEVEWRTGPGDGPRGTAEDAGREAADLGRLPGEALESFRAALKIKNLTALKTLAAELETSPATASAGAEIARLTRSFDFAGLADLADKLQGD